MATKEVRNAREKTSARISRRNQGNAGRSDTQKDDLKRESCEDASIEEELRLRLQDREDTIKRLTRERDDAVRKNRTLTAEHEGARKKLPAQFTTEDTPVAEATRSRKLCNYDENTANGSEKRAETRYGGGQTLVLT